MKRLSRWCAIALFLATPSAAQQYDPGASAEEIKLGQTAPYSGPLSAVAMVGFASTAFFESLNRKGGVNGRR